MKKKKKIEKKIVRWIPRKQGNNFAVGTESKYWKLTKLENLSIFGIIPLFPFVMGPL